MKQISLILIVVAIQTFALQRTLRAQTSEVLTQTAETITSATLTHQLAGLAAESPRDRLAPSAALERTAQYVAARFQALGLRPGINNDFNDSVWIQRYPVPGRTVQLDSASHVVFWYTPHRSGHVVVTEDGESMAQKITVSFPTSARFVVPWVPEWRPFFEKYVPHAVLLTGRLTAAFVRQAQLEHKSVLYIPPADLDPAVRQAIVDTLYEMSQGVVLLTDSARFMTPPTSTPAPLAMLDPYLRRQAMWDVPISPWAVEVPVNILAGALLGLGVDVEQVRAATVGTPPAVRKLLGLRAGIVTVFDSTDTAFAKAPNVAGILEGSDSALKRFCVVVAAPMDPWDQGPAARPADASTASLGGLIELARAFQALPVRPKYSVAFLATSGSAAGQAFWGSRYYMYDALQIAGGSACNPFVNLTVDLRKQGSATGDTAMIAGLDDMELPSLPPGLTGFHSELGLTIGNGGTVMEPRSDAFAFGERGIPSLWVQGGPGVFNADRAARLLRLAFYLSQQFATTVKQPHLSAAGRQRSFAPR